MPVVQHGRPFCPQHTPATHLPPVTVHVDPLAMHALPSQHAGAVQALFWQQRFPGVPQALQTSMEHTVPVDEHVVPLSKHRLTVESQQAPGSVHCMAGVVPGQHAAPAVPHVRQAPLVQMLSVPLQLPPLVTQWLLESQHDPEPRQLAPWQHASPLEPQAVQVPDRQMVFGVVQARSAAMQVSVAGSQHAPGALHTWTGQHVEPVAPQAWQVPPAQTRLPWHAAPAATHVLLSGSQHPVPSQVLPKQHDSPG